MWLRLLECQMQSVPRGLPKRMCQTLILHHDPVSCLHILITWSFCQQTGMMPSCTHALKPSSDLCPLHKYCIGPEQDPTPLQFPEYLDKDSSVLPSPLDSTTSCHLWVRLQKVMRVAASVCHIPCSGWTPLLFPCEVLVNQLACQVDTCEELVESLKLV